MAEENPAVSHYYQQVPIVKMPKKGGIGLNNSFKQMAQWSWQKQMERNQTVRRNKLF